MATKKSIDHKESIFRTLRSYGWEQDRWGHYKFTQSNGKELRVKVQAKSLRLERKCLIGDKNEWIRVSSDFFGNIKVEGNGVTIGGVRIKNPELGGK